MNNPLIEKVDLLLGGFSQTADLRKVHDLLSQHICRLHRLAAQDFHIGQTVSFFTEKDFQSFTGVVDNINRDGKIKVKLVGNARWSSYSMGAQELKRDIELFNKKYAKQL